jgi:hypothetical protein
MDPVADLGPESGKLEIASGPSILFVAMQSSIHTARWIQLASDLGVSLHLFPIDGWPPNPNLRGVILHLPEPKPELPSTLVEPSRARMLTRSAARFTLIALSDPARAARLLAARLQNRLQRMRAPSSANTLPRRVARFGRIALSNPLKAARILARRLRNGLVARDLSLGQITDRTAFDERRYTVTVDDLGPVEAIIEGQIRLGESLNTCPAHFGPWVLAALIRRLKPTLIHSMEFQHAGYLVLKAKEVYGAEFPQWIATNWGSDIFYFRRFADHGAQLRRLLSSIDYYSCECHRDVGLARELGYQGPVLPVLPNSGGFDLEQVCRMRAPGPPSRRKLLMIKGYHHFAGRAMTSIRVLETFAERLKAYEIILFSVSAEPRAAAIDLAERKVLNIRVIDSAQHDEILAHFGRARLYMGISISDAISTSALEAMAMGAFPIQTNTSCCDEWFEDGKGGFIVPPDDFDTICDRFLQALNDDALVDQAAEINWATVRARLDIRVLRGKVEAFYRQIFDGSLAAADPSAREQP